MEDISLVFLANQFDTTHLFYIYFLFLIKLNRRDVIFMESAAYLNRREGRVPGSVSNLIHYRGPAETVQLFPLSTPSLSCEKVSTLSSTLIVYCYKYLFVVKIITYQLKKTRASRAYGWDRAGDLHSHASYVI